MRVGFDASVIFSSVGGTRTYAQQLLSALFEARPEWTFFPYARSDEQSTVLRSMWPKANVEPRVVMGSPNVVRLQVRMPAVLTRDRIDVYHSLGYFLPLRWAGPKVVTVFDVNVYVNWRQWARPRKAVNWIDMAVQIPLAVRAATRIITLSEASKELICRMLHVEQQRIAVVAGAPDPFFDESPSKAEAAEATALTGGRPYVLFVGIISPQKNLETLVRAFAKSALGGEDVALVLAGSDREGEGTALKRLAAATGAGGQLVLTGFVSQPVLRALYHRAEAVVMPSHGEGFGLPLVEAMASGAPVLAANRQSLPEVAGDAGVLFEPDDVDDLARLLRRVHQDPAFRRDLVERGHKRRHVYSWKAAAEATARIYDEVASIRR